MPVPSTLASVAGQMREALKLALSSGATPLTVIPLSAPYTEYTDRSKYPLCKVYSGKGTTLNRAMGKNELWERDIFVEVTPWSTIDTFEEVMDELMPSIRSCLDIDAVRALMDPAYQGQAANLVVVGDSPLDTSLDCPAAALVIQLKISYAQSW